MQYGGMYFNPKIYLPYQRNFIFINSERNIGKTYTTQGFLIDRYLQRGERFAYVCRTANEMKDGILKSAFSKVVTNEFDYDRIEYTSHTMSWVTENEKGKKDREEMGYCLALSEANKKKKVNYPGIRWLLLDEYIIDSLYTQKEYVEGPNEPNLFLKLYHTLDRENDYITCWFLANAINFYNPYHIHPAFMIPKVEKGEIWTSENVLYHWTSGSEDLKKKKSNSKFLKMIEGTEYGNYAIEGDFIMDSDSFVDKRPGDSVCRLIIRWHGEDFGIWYSYQAYRYYIDDVVAPGIPKCVIDKRDLKEGYVMLKKNDNKIRHIAMRYRGGRVSFCSQTIKAKFEGCLHCII